jgi:hypothetical protein
LLLGVREQMRLNTSGIENYSCNNIFARSQLLNRLLKYEIIYSENVLSYLISSFIYLSIYLFTCLPNSPKTNYKLKKKKLHGLSPRVNYID